MCARMNGDGSSRHRRLRLHPAVGMHPEKADLAALDDMLRLIDEHADEIVCVGEVGLDFSRHLIGEAGGERAERAKETQREVFRRQARRAEVRWGVSSCVTNETDWSVLILCIHPPPSSRDGCGLRKRGAAAGEGGQGNDRNPHACRSELPVALKEEVVMPPLRPRPLSRVRRRFRFLLREGRASHSWYFLARSHRALTHRSAHSFPPCLNYIKSYCLRSLNCLLTCIAAPRGTTPSRCCGKRVSRALSSTPSTASPSERH